MKISIYKNYNEMCSAAAALIIEQVKAKPGSLLCFPSGDSPAGVYKKLIISMLNGEVDFSNCYFIGLDEWVGMGAENEGSCTHSLLENFFTPANIQSDKIMFFDAKADDLDLSCKKMDNFVMAKGPIDVMMVGIGMNGHIGLNEPGISVELYAHHSALTPVTIEVAKKYFKERPSLHEGITLGLKHLSESKMPLLIASGEKKAEIIEKALQEDVTTQLPASIFQILRQSRVLLDDAAASKLSEAKM